MNLDVYRPSDFSPATCAPDDLEWAKTIQARYGDVCDGSVAYITFWYKYSPDFPWDGWPFAQGRDLFVINHPTNEKVTCILVRVVPPSPSLSLVDRWLAEWASVLAEGDPMLVTHAIVGTLAAALERAFLNTVGARR